MSLKKAANGEIILVSDRVDDFGQAVGVWAHENRFAFDFERAVKSGELAPNAFPGPAVRINEEGNPVHHSVGLDEEGNTVYYHDSDAGGKVVGAFVPCDGDGNAEIVPL